jgi:cell division septation protein DedD
MSQPPTHYQISITSKQALALFVGLLAVLGLSYFFGLMTGLAGHEPVPEGSAGAEVASNAAEAPAPTPATAAERNAPENIAFPVPVTAAPSAGGPARAAPRTVQVFEDGEGGTAPTPGVRARASTTPRREAPAGGFRVQVLSVSSRADAEAEAARLTRQGLPARVEPGAGPRGTVYRVRVGPYATREEAEEASRKLSSQGRRDTWIVRPSQ